MNQYEVVYWELTRISRIVKASSPTQAIRKSEKLRAARDWSDCQEETEGTSGVERVYRIDTNGVAKEEYTTGTVAGMIDPPETGHG